MLGVIKLQGFQKHIYTKFVTKRGIGCQMISKPAQIDRSRQDNLAGSCTEHIDPTFCIQSICLHVFFEEAYTLPRAMPGTPGP